MWAMPFGGSDGDDVLYDDPRSTEITGGRGNDVLNGGRGGDVYIWNPGDGNDTIVNNGAWGVKNVLRFGPGVSPQDVSLRGEGNDLFVTFGGTGETITVKNWFVDSAGRLNSLEFSDGTVWDQGKIEGLRNKEIKGTDGDDRLEGACVDDILIGGKGDNELRGGGGNDTYVWNPGDGNDVIYNGWNWNTRGVLKFGEGVSPNKIQVNTSGADLVFLIKETGEKITVRS